MTSANVSMRIWHNSIIPWARQLSRAERRGNAALAAQIRDRIAEHTSISEPVLTVEQAMHELLRALRAEGTAPLRTSVSTSESTAVLTLLRRGAVIVERGRLTLRDDLRVMDVELLLLMHGTYPELADLDIDAGVGGVLRRARAGAP